ncbi:MAG: PqqD family protein [Ruminococcaceae bacterium]|nr:PqqD family protein [Oscillospiraceae bacterium]
MKIKKGFVKQKLGDTTIIVSTGELSREFHGMIELNETGAEIWDCISSGMNLIETAQKLSEEYGIDIQKATDDVTKIVNKMLEAGVFENE